MREARFTHINFFLEAMDRRNFVKSTTATLMAGLVPSSMPGFAGTWFSKEYDRYGGWTGKKFQATGFFRIEKDERWWFVTPEGNAFLSFGINHLSPNFFNQAFNANQWQKIFGIHNISRKEEYHPALRKWFLQTCKDFGFNTVGAHNAYHIINTPQPEMPYVQGITFVDIPHWKPVVPDEHLKDIFSLAFATEADDIAKQIASSKKDDPYL